MASASSLGISERRRIRKRALSELEIHIMLMDRGGICVVRFRGRIYDIYIFFFRRCSVARACGKSSFESCISLRYVKIIAKSPRDEVRDDLSRNGNPFSLNVSFTFGNTVIYNRDGSIKVQRRF